MLAGTDDHLTWLSPVILNLESTGLTHLKSEMRVAFVGISQNVSYISFALFPQTVTLPPISDMKLPLRSLERTKRKIGLSTRIRSKKSHLYRLFLEIYL